MAIRDTDLTIVEDGYGGHKVTTKAGVRYRLREDTYGGLRLSCDVGQITITPEAANTVILKEIP